MPRAELENREEWELETFEFRCEWRRYYPVGVVPEGDAELFPAVVEDYVVEVGVRCCVICFPGPIGIVWCAG